MLILSMYKRNALKYLLFIGDLTVAQNIQFRTRIR